MMHLFQKNVTISGMMLAFVCLFTPCLASVVRAESALEIDETEWSEQSEEETAAYTENEWNFVDGSMDISGGIPENAAGRLDKIRKAGVLTVATEPYYAPQEFIDPTLTGQDQYVGADIELAKLIALRMGVELELVPLDFTDVFTAVQEGTCDLAISGLAYTPGRASLMELSKGYHYSADGTTTGLMIREADLEKIASISDLARRDIVAQRGSLQEMLLAEHVSVYRQFRRVISTQEVYRQLQDGVSDAAAVDLESARLYIRSNPDCGLTLVDGIVFRLDEQFEGDRIAGRKGDLELMYFVNGVIDEVLASGAYEDWFETYSEYAAELGL